MDKSVSPDTLRVFCGIIVTAVHLTTKDSDEFGRMVKRACADDRKRYAYLDEEECVVLYQLVDYLAESF